MKTLLLILSIFTALGASAQSLKESREKFHAAVMDAQESRAFHEFLKKAGEEDPAIFAYQAVSEAMLAQVMWNPFSKFAQVMKYDRKITKAVEMDPENIEIRFLRLAIEVNLPSFLGMSVHMDEDLNVILSNMNRVGSMDVDPAYGQYIFYFLEANNLCTNDQILAMKESLSQASSL